MAVTNRMYRYTWHKMSLMKIIDGLEWTQVIVVILIEEGIQRNDMKQVSLSSWSYLSESSHCQLDKGWFVSSKQDIKVSQFCTLCWYSSVKKIQIHIWECQPPASSKARGYCINTYWICHQLQEVAIQDFVQ